MHKLNAAKNEMREEPPALTKGSGIPAIGSNPMTIPILITI
jgi:hypothetical protein